MAKVLLSMTVSLDGYVNDKRGDIKSLYPDLHGLKDTQALQGLILETGAVIMGMNTFDMADNDFTGYEFQVPVFVLTENAPLANVKGVNEKLRFNFVKDGPDKALRKAKLEAKDKFVTIIGGALTSQQFLKAGLVDEIQLGIVPVLLGEGQKLFTHLGREIRMEQLKVMASNGRTDIRYRIIKNV
jgi:dihydrofolate reductase